MMRQKLKNVVVYLGLGFATVVVCCFAASAVWGQQGTLATPQEKIDISASAPGIPSYPDSPSGLERMMKDMLKLEKKGDTAGLTPYLQNLVLPNADSWFKKAFGNDVGTGLAGMYQQTSQELPVSIPGVLSKLIQEKMTDPLAIRFKDSCDLAATSEEYPFLLLRQGPQPLYDVRFSEGRSFAIVPYFAYVDGAFRYLGNMQVATSWPSRFHKVNSGEILHGSIGDGAKKVEGNVQAAKLIHQVMPTYPAGALNARFGGTVIYHAIIAKDGSVQDLQLLLGSCSFAESARKAVSKWRYSPTLLNGEPVEVDTTIKVIYNLRQ